MYLLTNVDISPEVGNTKNWLRMRPTLSHGRNRFIVRFKGYMSLLSQFAQKPCSLLRHSDLHTKSYL